MKKRLFTGLGLGLLLVSLSACDAFESKDKVYVQLLGKDIIVTNHTSSPIYTVAYEREILALINWAKCEDASVCEGIKQGRTHTIPLEDIWMYEEGREVVVFWWHLHKPFGSDKYRVEHFTSVVIDT